MLTITVIIISISWCLHKQKYTHLTKKQSELSPAMCLVLSVKGQLKLDLCLWRIVKKIQRQVNHRITWFRSVQLLSHVWLFATPWTAVRQASLSINTSWSLLKLMSIESVMPSNHLILCCPFLLQSSIFPSIRVFSNASVLCIKWPTYGLKTRDQQLWGSVMWVSESQDTLQVWDGSWKISNRNLQVRVVVFERMFWDKEAEMKIFLWLLTNMFQGDSKTSQFSSYFPKCDVSVVQARAFAHLPRSTLQNILVPVTHHHHRLINCYDSFQPSWICTTAKQILHEICLQVSD